MRNRHRCVPTWSDKKFRNENQSGPIWASCALAWRGCASSSPGFSLIMRLNRHPWSVNRIAVVNRIARAIDLQPLVGQTESECIVSCHPFPLL